MSRITNSNIGVVSSAQAAPSGRTSFGASSRAVLAMSSLSSQNSANLARPQPIRDQRLQQTLPKDLTFGAGDIILCRRDNTRSHFFLARSKTRVIHALRPESGNRNVYTRVRDELFVTAATRDNYTTCSVATDWYDGQMYSQCNRRQPVSNVEAIKSARKSVSTCTRHVSPYDDANCSSEHYVTSWKYGIALAIYPGPFADQLAAPRTNFKSQNCVAPGLNTCSAQ